MNLYKTTPETFCEYEKQEWLINTVGGFCNPKKAETAE